MLLAFDHFLPEDQWQRPWKRRIEDIFRNVHFRGKNVAEKFSQVGFSALKSAMFKSFNFFQNASNAAPYCESRYWNSCPNSTFEVYIKFMVCDRKTSSLKNPRKYTHIIISPARWMNNLFIVEPKKAIFWYLKFY